MTMALTSQTLPDAATDHLPAATAPESNPLKTALHSGKRILVVDDCELTVVEVTQDLSRAFPAESHNSIEHCTNPTRALELIRSASAEGAPYDALVLDLRMPVMNGDELLRSLARENLLVPTLVHSGSHASEIHTVLLPQIDAVRAQEIELKLAEVSKQLSNVADLDELDQLKRSLSDLTLDIPLLFLQKYGVGYSTSTLIEKIDLLLLAGERIDWQRFNAAVAEFKPKTTGNDANSDYVELCSELTRLVGKKGREIRSLLLEVDPSRETDKQWDYFDSRIRDTDSPQYSVKGLSDIEKGHTRRHRLPSVVNHPGHVALELVMDDSGEILPAFQARPEAVDDIRAFSNFCLTCVSLIRTAREMAQEPKPIWLRSDHIQFKSQALGVAGLEIDPIAFQVVSHGEAVYSILEQLVLNAGQAVKGRAEPKVQVSAKALTHDELPPTVQQQTSKKPCAAGYVEVSVTDNGSGIPAQIIDQIFEEGFTTRADGTGFGLAHVKSTLAKLGGGFLVKSRVGEGSTFFVYMPLAESPSATRVDQ